MPSISNIPPHPDRRLLHCKTLLSTFSLLVLLLAGAGAHGTTVQVSWDPNTEPHLAGYKVYLGTSSRAYTSQTDVGKTTLCTVSNLEPGRTYYFAITAHDGNGAESDFSTEVTAAIPATIPAQNRAPTAQDGSITVNPGAASTGVLKAADPDGDPLTFSLAAMPAKGTVTLDNAATGAFTYRANAGTSGTDGFTFRAGDGKLTSAAATVTVFLANRAPTAQDGTLTAVHGTATTGTLAASDPDGDPMTFSIVTGAARGELSLVNARTGAFSYRPNAGMTGIDSFTFRVTDGNSFSATATVTINIANRAPAAEAGSHGVAPDSSFTGTLKGSDPDGDPLTFTIVANATRGQVTLNNSATGAFTYSPNAGVTGSDAFTFRVSDGKLTSPTATVAMTITSREPRVTEGLQALYTFDEGAGTKVFDVSGVGKPLDLTVSGADKVRWVDGGLAVTGSTLIASPGAASKIIDAARAANGITIEAWVKPADTAQNGPARLVTLSRDLNRRNFTLGQGVPGGSSSVYDVRLRTTTTDLNGVPSVSSPAGSLSTQLTHVVYTRNSAGAARLYIDGAQKAARTVGGTFSNWDTACRLALANELSGDRPWLGEYHLVAVYSRALSVSEIARNLKAGANPNEAKTAPVITGQPENRTVNAGESAVFSVSAEGSSPLLYQWQRRSGSTWTDIPDAIQASYTISRAALEDDNTAYRCRVWNTVGAITSAEASLSVLVKSGGERVAVGLQALYRFNEGGGSVVRDVSGVGEPLDLTVSNSGGVRWVNGGGLAVTGSTVIASSGPAAKIIKAVGSTAAGASISNLVTNPGFEGGVQNWTFYTNGKGSFTAPTPGHEGSLAAQVQITTAGSNTQLYQAGIALDPDTEYRLSFAAYSSSGRDLSVTLQKHGSPYTSYGLSKQMVNLGTQWAIHSFSFRTPKLAGPVNDARLMFWLADTAAVGDRFHIDRIVLSREETSPPPATEITVEAWVKPENTIQNGPARIVSLSSDLYNRNFTLGQGIAGGSSAVYEMRLRTTATDANGNPSLSSPGGFLITRLTHFVYTRDASGAARIYVDGVERAAGTLQGTFANWDAGFRLALANELTGDRPWLGEYHLVALYNRALSPEDVNLNYLAGPR
jgi:hypothetical protein